MDWLRHAGAAGWLVLSKDKAIRRRSSEREAVQDAGVLMFVLTSASLTGAQMAEAFVAALPRIARIAASAKPPAIYAVSRDGSTRRVAS